MASFEGVGAGDEFADDSESTAGGPVVALASVADTVVEPSATMGGEEGILAMLDLMFAAGKAGVESVEGWLDDS